MGFFNPITNAAKKVTGKVTSAVKKHEAKKKQEGIRLRKMRAKSAPMMKKIANEYGAGLEILDTSALFTKKVNGEEKRVHVPYGLDAEDIRNRVDRAFVGSSTKSKVKSAIKTGKEIHKALKESGFGNGANMWGDPKNMYR